MFPCNDCGEEFTQKKSLNQHIERGVCNKERTHKCTLCPKAFKNKKSLTSHKCIGKLNQAFKTARKHMLERSGLDSTLDYYTPGPTPEELEEVMKITGYDETYVANNTPDSLNGMVVVGTDDKDEDTEEGEEEEEEEKEESDDEDKRRVYSDRSFVPKKKRVLDPNRYLNKPNNSSSNSANSTNNTSNSANNTSNSTNNSANNSTSNSAQQFGVKLTKAKRESIYDPADSPLAYKMGNKISVIKPSLVKPTNVSKPEKDSRLINLKKIEEAPTLESMIANDQSRLSDFIEIIGKAKELLRDLSPFYENLCSFENGKNIIKFANLLPKALINPYHAKQQKCILTVPDRETIIMELIINENLTIESLDEALHEHLHALANGKKQVDVSNNEITRHVREGKEASKIDPSTIPSSRVFNIPTASTTTFSTVTATTNSTTGTNRLSSIPTIKPTIKPIATSSATTTGKKDTMSMIESIKTKMRPDYVPDCDNPNHPNYVNPHNINNYNYIGDKEKDRVRPRRGDYGSDNDNDNDEYQLEKEQEQEQEQEKEQEHEQEQEPQQKKSEQKKQYAEPRIRASKKRLHYYEDSDSDEYEEADAEGAITIKRESKESMNVLMDKLNKQSDKYQAHPAITMDARQFQPIMKGHYVNVIHALLGNPKMYETLIYIKNLGIAHDPMEADFKVIKKIYMDGRRKTEIPFKVIDIKRLRIEFLNEKGEWIKDTKACKLMKILTDNLINTYIIANIKLSEIVTNLDDKAKKENLLDVYQINKSQGHACLLSDNKMHVKLAKRLIDFISNLGEDETI
jgi:hypothetical protein